MRVLPTLLDIVRPPAPLRVTLPLMSRIGLPLLALIDSVPALLMVGPNTVKIVPSTSVRLSSLSTVRFPHWAPLKLIVTGEAPVLTLSIKTLLLLVGTPTLHLVPSLQSPVPPSQLSF